MPQPLDAQIAAGMAPGARAATVAGLIPKVDAEIAAIQAEHDRLDKLSKSASTSDADADEAADAASKLARKLVRLGAQKVELEERHEGLMNSERRFRGLAEYEAAKATRDQLAADIAEEYPVLVGRLVDLIKRIIASDAEIEKVNAARYGAEWLASAEAIARDCPANFHWRHGGSVVRITRMKIPSLLGYGHEEILWPPRFDISGEIAEGQHRAAMEAQKVARANADKLQRWLVTPPDGISEAISIETYHGLKSVYRSPGTYRMSSAQAKAAEAKGCAVRLASASEAIGLPVAASF